MVTKLYVFEFWFKICYGLISAIAALLAWSRIENPSQSLGIQCLSELTKVSGIALFSIIHGLQWLTASKFMVGVMVSVYFSVLAVNCLYYTKDTVATTIVITDGVSIGLIRFVGGINKTLAIFLWKQTLCSLLRKEKATLIKHTPRIEWKTSHFEYPRVQSSVEMNEQLANSYQSLNE